MRILITDIKHLVQIREKQTKPVCGNAMQRVPMLQHAWLLLENDLIHSYGLMTEEIPVADESYSASGRLVLPAFCDSHTHLLWTGNRSGEFVDRINGLSYEAIAANGGGILNSAKKLNNTSEEVLLESAWERTQQIINTGTGAVEIKSGYGLSFDGEMKMLRVIKKLKETSPLTIKATFLGAHAYPVEFKNNHAGYLKLIIGKMLPAIADEGLADFIDVFCDRGFFSPDETAQILDAGARYGLRPKIHANELGLTGGVQTAVAHQALSVDHLEYCGGDEIHVLKQADTIPTLLPGTSFFLNLPYAPARNLLDAGLPIALASDFNPGSTPSGNVPLMMAIACLKMHLMPEEVINATTLNGAYAMDVVTELGSISKGNKANLIITEKMQDIRDIPYAYGSNPVYRMMLNGEWV